MEKLFGILDELEIEKNIDELKNYETRQLNFQLVPETAFYDNLRSMIPNWSDVSNKVREVGQCAICGAVVGDIRKLDAHEVWSYDDKNHIQFLKNIIPVCKSCHQSIHIGRAEVQGYGEEAMLWYSHVNELTLKEAIEDRNKAFYIWKFRSEYEWKKDPNILQRVTELIGVNTDFSKPINGKYYLCVPYSQKDRAKQHGAKFDWTEKMWYYTNINDKEKFSEWLIYNNT